MPANRQQGYWFRRADKHQICGHKIANGQHRSPNDKFGFHDRCVNAEQTTEDQALCLENKILMWFDGKNCYLFTKLTRFQALKKMSKNVRRFDEKLWLLFTNGAGGSNRLDSKFNNDSKNETRFDGKFWLLFTNVITDSIPSLEQNNTNNCKIKKELLFLFVCYSFLKKTL